MGMFGDSLRQNGNKILSEVDKEISNIIVDGFNQAPKLSPAQPDAQYAKGEFINNWRLGINSTDSSTSGVLSMEGASSYASIAQLLTAGAFLGKDSFVTLSNNTSYSDKIEYIGWPSGKAPYAPLRNTITYFISKRR